jgi:hypothetical protein
VAPEKNDLVGIKLVSGLRNVQYGVWRSRCCGEEIVLYVGAIFPTCNKHKDAFTEWVFISSDILKPSKQAKPISAANSRRPGAA